MKTSAHALCICQILAHLETKRTSSQDCLQATIKAVLPSLRLFKAQAHWALKWWNDELKRKKIFFFSPLYTSDRMQHSGIASKASPLYKCTLLQYHFRPPPRSAPPAQTRSCPTASPAQSCLKPHQPDPAQWLPAPTTQPATAAEQHTACSGNDKIPTVKLCEERINLTWKEMSIV